ncbi:polyketide synthase-like Pks10 [Rhizocola hellebori]|uniref:Polyketide synthase-like Pks10 n=1 Tax=Rhizocola hellebori TaxID=1392758 RepID=A0A8J3Q4T9_9ACTN|nr:3-oxoacyl-[acyl-carrier-protein] synthase III C-terminal domain-containing protein [Rhizocola hellebori]GIH03338.1 polyketide synthase-like Pks10 [Rhizocola hellebori]
MNHSWANAPAVAAVEVALPSHVHSQEEIISELSRFGGPVFERFARTAGVQTRRLAMPLARYGRLSGFTEANETYLEVALELGEQALTAALKKAGIQPDEVDLIVSTTVTGLTVPSLEARLANRMGLRPDVKRVPLFGLGCVAGAAGIARMHDYLRAFPDQVAVLLAVELCSLTIQRDDTSAANLVASSLFGDGAAAVVATGAAVSGAGPRVLSSRSHLYPDTEGVMGWDIGTQGFRIILSTEVAPIAEKYLAEGVESFLAAHGLSTHDISAWICHPGGPKVIETIQRVLSLPPQALAHTRNSLRDKGNLSSVSVLDVLGETMAQPPAAGGYGLMIAMGPGFCSELVLVRW